jgi:hypothetical protein
MASLRMAQGFQRLNGRRIGFATNFCGADPVLHGLKNEEVMRPASANRNTVKALEKHDLIVQRRGGDPLRIEWQLKKPKQ